MDKEQIQRLLGKKEYYQYKIDPERNFREQGAHHDEAGILKPHSHQLFIRNYISPTTDNKRILLMHGTGCHAEGTKILMFDGSIRNVETINRGEFLMGDDGRPRIVLDLIAGRQLMINVIPEYGEPFVCNLDHILTVDNGREKQDISIRQIIVNEGYSPQNMVLYKYSPPIVNGLTIEQRTALLSKYPVEHCDRGAYREIPADLQHIANSLGYYVEGGTRAYIRGWTKFRMHPVYYTDRFYGFSLTGNRRYLLGDYIVTHNTGKTLGAVLIAQPFVEVYRRMYADLAIKIGNKNYEELDINTPTVYVLGFGSTRAAFTKELLHYSEFGFVTHLERDDLLRRQKAAAESPDLYWDYYKYLRRRIFNKSKGGFYKFYGYQEFVNRLFIGDVKLIDIVGEEDDESTDGPTLEQSITEYIKAGKIQVNTAMLRQLNNSVIICDEIHDTYNSRMKNNYGVAIQYILDAVPTLRAVFMSATPINNSPTEVVEVLNYLGSDLRKSDIFTDTGALLPDGLARIATTARGRVSFLQDSNIRYFPRRNFMGIPCKLRKPVTMKTGPVVTEIPYLQFIECPMSQLHQSTCDELAGAKLSYQPYSYHRMPSDGYTLFNMVYPNPDSETVGLYTSGIAKTKIETASREWQDKHGIYVKRQGVSYVFSGQFLLRENIGRYSTKFAKLLEILDDLLKGDSGKILIYHHRVRMDGVLQIAELLRFNGIVDENTEPTDNTRCAICGVARGEHPKDGEHTYKAARFVTAHSDIEKSLMEANLGKFNDPANINGHEIKILIGSRIIRQGYDFKGCQHNIIVSKPLNIPTLIQIFGRSIRKRSHIDLPPSRRVVNIYILLSTVNDAYPHADEVTHEQYHYVDKLGDYQIIQEIEATLSTVAIDADIHRDIIMPPQLRAMYGDPPKKMLGALYFEPEQTVHMEKLSLDTLTFNARGHVIEEIERAIYIIKRLFAERTVWTYDELWAQVQTPPIGLETNPRLIAEENFALALSRMCAVAPNIVDNTNEIINHLYDPTDTFIYRGTQRYKIEQIDKYYCIFPCEFNGGYRSEVDIELYARIGQHQTAIQVNLPEYVQTARAILNFGARRDQYMQAETISIFEYTIDFQQAMLEEIITNWKAKSKKIARYREIIDLYGKYEAILFSGEVSRYKDIAKQFDSFPPADHPIGYTTQNSVRLWNGKAWFNVSKVALNRYVQYRDNDKIVGYFEQIGDSMKFKVRKPSQFLVNMRADKKDTRLIEKGTVCVTKNKNDLINILAMLGISHKKISAGLKIKNICDMVLERLLHLEALERAGGTRVKWFYNWFDEQPDIIYRR